MPPPPTDWQWHPPSQWYFSPSTGIWAQQDPQTGEWTYRGPDGGETVMKESRRTETETETAQGEGGIGDVGWALEADLDKNRDMKNTKRDLNVQNHNVVRNEAIRRVTPSTASPSTPPVPVCTPTPAPAPQAPKILRLVLRTTSAPFSSPRQARVAILDARPGGYYLGRDRSPGVPVLRIKEMEVSRLHARIWWGFAEEQTEEGGDRGEKGFWIMDCGSTHGTFLLPPSSKSNAIRLSPPRQSSLPRKLSHNTRLTLGSTTFECHLHSDWPCDECALGENPPLTIDDSSKAIPTTSNNPTASPTDTAAAPGWNKTEPRQIAMTSEAKKMDQSRRAGSAMQSLKARYFGAVDGNSTGGKKGAGKGNWRGRVAGNGARGGSGER